MNTRVKAAIAIRKPHSRPFSVPHPRVPGRAETSDTRAPGSWTGSSGDLRPRGGRALDVCGAVTTRMRLGAAVFLTALHSPVHMAKRFATLDGLFGGRLIVSRPRRPPRPIRPTACRPSDAPRASRKGSRVMKRLWTEPRVTFDASSSRSARPPWSRSRSETAPAPLVRRPHPNALNVQWPSAGFIGAGSSPTTQFVDEVRLVDQMLAKPSATRGIPRGQARLPGDRLGPGPRGQAPRQWFGAFYGRPEMAPPGSPCRRA